MNVRQATEVYLFPVLEKPLNGNDLIISLMRKGKNPVTYRYAFYAAGERPKGLFSSPVLMTNTNYINYLAPEHLCCKKREHNPNR